MPALIRLLRKTRDQELTDIITGWRRAEGLELRCQGRDIEHGRSRSMLSPFYAPPQVRCGTCPPTTPLKWRSWTTRCTPSPTRWWCRTRVGSKGATVPEPGRRTANRGTWSGRRPSPTQPAAWGTQGWWAGDGRRVAACRCRREMERRQVSRMTEWQDECGRKRTRGSRNCRHASSRRRQTPAVTTQNKTWFN